MQVLLGTTDQSGSVEIGHHGDLRLGDGEPPVGLGRIGGNAAILANHLNGLQPVAAHDLEVVGVVRRGHLQRTGAKCRVHMTIPDDRHLTARQGQRDGLAHHVAVTLVVGVHRNRGITQHRLGTHGGHHDLARAIAQRVGDAHEGVSHLPVLHLEVGDRRSETGIPVDQIRIAVDVALLIQVNEDPQHGLCIAVIHGEALACVVHGATEPGELLDDATAVLGLPLPHALKKLLAGQVGATHPLRGQLLLNHCLGCDAGVVGAAYPLSLKSVHTVTADEHVLDGAVECVPHVQGTGDVGRWHCNDVRRARA